MVDIENFINDKEIDGWIDGNDMQSLAIMIHDEDARNENGFNSSDTFILTLVGKTVKSKNTGNLGVVSQVALESKREDRYDSLTINWSHGGVSRIFVHYQIDGIVFKV